MSPNCDLRRSRCPIEARLEKGDVLLTASIAEVLRQLILTIMPGNFALRREISESIPGHTGELGRLSKGKNCLCVKRQSEFRAQAGFNLRLRKAETSSDRLRDVQMIGHGLFNEVCLLFIVAGHMAEVR